MRIFGGLILIFIFLGACTSLEDRVARSTDVCETYGYTRGSEAMANCVAEEIRAAQARGAVIAAGSIAAQ